jgi:hypothetical protein
MKKCPIEMAEKFVGEVEEVFGRLRQETKRNDLPEETVRMLSKVYWAIGGMLRMRSEDIRTIERLEAQYGVQLSALDEAKGKITRMRDGFEGCCPLCETVGLINVKLSEELRSVQRELCMVMGGRGGRSSSESPDAVEYAKSRGWECHTNQETP